jgi:hypothetical protein
MSRAKVRLHRLADTPECCWPFFSCLGLRHAVAVDDFVPRFPSRAITTFIHGVVITIEDDWLARFLVQTTALRDWPKTQSTRKRTKKRAATFPHAPPLQTTEGSAQLFRQRWTAINKMAPFILIRRLFFRGVVACLSGAEAKMIEICGRGLKAKPDAYEK